MGGRKLTGVARVSFESGPCCFAPVHYVGWPGSGFARMKLKPIGSDKVSRGTTDQNAHALRSARFWFHCIRVGMALWVSFCLVLLAARSFRANDRSEDSPARYSYWLNIGPHTYGRVATDERTKTS